MFDISVNDGCECLSLRAEKKPASEADVGDRQTPAECFGLSIISTESACKLDIFFHSISNREKNHHFEQGESKPKERSIQQQTEALVQIRNTSSSNNTETRQQRVTDDYRQPKQTYFFSQQQQFNNLTTITTRQQSQQQLHSK